MQIQAMLKKFLHYFFPPKHYAFSVKFKYFSKGKYQPIFSYEAVILLKNKHDILNARKVKKVGEPLHLLKPAKPLLCNGRLELIVVAYLGKLKLPRKNQKP